jgi:hypothetical protein
MSHPFDRILTVPELRGHLGLPREPADGNRELLVVRRDLGEPVPAAGSWRLALGDWPDAWRAEHGAGPRFLVMLHGTASPYFIATIEDIDAEDWGLDGDAEPDQRVVPVRGTAYATAELAGDQLELDLMFGWDRPEEQYAFM